MFNKLLPYILVLLSWSPQSFSAAIEFYKLVPQSYSLQVGKPYEIENMPRFRSTDSFSVCASVSLATLLTAQHCRANKIQDCKSLPPDQEFSTLHIVQYTNKTNGKLNFGGDIDVVGPENLRQSGFRIYPESCAPLDQIAEKNKGKSGKVEKDIARLKIEFNKYDKQKTEGRICEECLIKIQSELNENFLAFPEIEQLRKILDDSATNSVGNLLYDVLFSKCKRERVLPLKLRPMPIVRYFPETRGGASYKEVINQLTTTLSRGYPLVASATCTDIENNNCKTRHAVVISGYKKVCKPAGAPCRDLVKVHESGGQEFQDKYNGGWVDGETLFNDLKGYRDLAWLEDAPPER